MCRNPGQVVVHTLARPYPPTSTHCSTRSYELLLVTHSTIPTHTCRELVRKYRDPAFSSVSQVIRPEYVSETCLQMKKKKHCYPIACPMDVGSHQLHLGDLGKSLAVRAGSEREPDDYTINGPSDV